MNKEKVDLPSVRSKFLLACVDYLNQEMGVADIVHIAKHRNETICATWDVGITDDFPSFCSEDGGWTFDNRNDDGGLLMMDVRDNGSIILRSLDGETEFLTTRIELPEEIGEVINLFKSIKPPYLEPPHWRTIPLSSIIEKVFLVLPKNGRDMLVPFDANHIAQQQPGLWRAIGVLQDLKINPEALNDLEYSNWAAFPEPVLPGPYDLFFSQDSGLHSWRLHAQRETEFFDVEPKLALRISPKHSPMFFYLFTQQTSEGRTLLNDLAVKFENVQACLKRTQVDFPTSIVSQRLFVFEFQKLRQKSDKRYESLVQVRGEPVKELLKLYDQRVRRLDDLRIEYTQEIEAVIQAVSYPLPFFLEYPLYRLRNMDASDIAEKMMCAKQLLSILVRSFVLLPLEEALTLDGCPQSVRTLVQEATRKPLSEGGWWNDLRRPFLEKCKEASLNLPLFGHLLESSAKLDEQLNWMINARNGFHHKRFYSQFDKDLPEVISFLRQHFADIRFLIPKSYRMLDGERTVKALDLKGHHVEFFLREFTVCASFDLFPCEQIVAMDKAGTHVVALGRFFTGKSLTAETIDIGIFDKVAGGRDHFEFVRGLGSDPEMAQK